METWRSNLDNKLSLYLNLKPYQTCGKFAWFPPSSFSLMYNFMISLNLWSLFVWWHSSNTIMENAVTASISLFFKAFTKICAVTTKMSLLESTKIEHLIFHNNPR